MKNRKNYNLQHTKISLKLERGMINTKLRLAKYLNKN